MYDVFTHPDMKSYDTETDAKSFHTNLWNKTIVIFIKFK